MGSLIWGILLVLLGAELIVKGVFGINIPVFRIAFGFFLIYTGISFLTNNGTNSGKKKVISFGKQTITVTKPQKKYQITFGEGILDFSSLEIKERTKINITISFGSGIIKINPNIPTKVIAESVFGSARFPDDTQISFGKYTYSTGPADQEPLLEIRAKVTFGSLVIQTQ